MHQTLTNQKRIRIKKRGIATLLAAALAVVPVTTVWSQQVPEPAEFVAGLLGYLEGQGWSGQEIAALAQQLRDQDFEEAEDVDPEVVGHALALAQDAGEMEPGEQAVVALELAAVAAAMHSVGLEERAVAVAAISGARDIVQNIGSWKDSGVAVGEAVRDTLVASVRSTAREQVRTVVAERATAVAQEGLSRAISGLPDVPGSADGGIPQYP